MFLNIKIRFADIKDILRAIYIYNQKYHWISSLNGKPMKNRIQLPNWKEFVMETGEEESQNQSARKGGDSVTHWWTKETSW